MEALLTARRTKAGQEDAFRRQWRSGKQPDGMRAAYLLEDEEHPRETLSLSFWDTPRQLLAYRASNAAKQREQQLRELVAKTRWQRPFAARGAAASNGGGRKLPLLLPLLLVAAGVGVFLVLKRRRQGPAAEQGQMEESAPQQPLPASGETPPADVTAAGIPASVSAGEGQTPGAGTPTA